MRFSAVFEPMSRPIAIGPAEERAPKLIASVTHEVPPEDDTDVVPDDLDQRVRQVGEWQLEDW